MSPVPIVEIARWANTVKAETKMVTRLIPRRVSIAQRGIRQVRVVPSANPVGRGRTVLGASRVLLVTIAMAVILMRSPVGIAQPGTTTTTSAKVLVCPAVQVNSTT
jgi:hypothetical protein